MSRVPVPVTPPPDEGQRHLDGGPLFGAAEPPDYEIESAATVLRALLSQGGYDTAAARLTGTSAAAGFVPGGDEYFSKRHDPAALERLQLCNPLTRLLLFVYLHGCAVPVRTAEDTLTTEGGATPLSRLLSLGLLALHPHDREWLVSPIQIYPLPLDDLENGDEELPACSRSRLLWLCTDWDLQTEALDRQFAIMPIGVDSLQLALALPPRSLKGRRVLDVCCGSGIQGLVAIARGAASVLSTDLSQRAARFTRFNAWLNGEAGKVQTAVGNVYTPSLEGLYAGERLFDIVLANPPFVAVPRSLDLRPALYVSGGCDGADVVRALVSGASEVLSPGGCLLIVTQLPNIGGAHEWLLHTTLESPTKPASMELLVVHDPVHTQSYRRYAAAHADDALCSPDAWKDELKGKHIVPILPSPLYRRTRQRVGAPTPTPLPHCARFVRSSRLV